MGRMISYVAWRLDPEEFLVSLSKGMDKDSGREIQGLAQGLIGQFKCKGGKFKHPSCFHRLHAGPYIQGDVIAFRPKPAEQPMSAYDLYWTRFYAALLGIDIEEQPVEIKKHDWRKIYIRNRSMT